MRKFLLSLVFAISAIAAQAQEPAIVMTTTKSVNSQFSFGIDAVAPNTPIQIDWGNGVKENFTIGDVTEFFGFPLKGSSVKIWGEGIASLNVTSMELTALDVTRATSLTYLYIKTNQIETLDLSNCTALTFVDCSENLLTSLNLPSTSTLVAVNCDNNLLTSLNVSGATGITELTCTNNKLTFATLPIKQPSWTTFTYSPQQNVTLPKQTYSTNEEIDLSSQLTIGSNNTTYTWKTANGTTLVSGTDYNVTGGKFTFLKTYTESLYCEMTNATFPSLILKTINISVLPAPSVIMTTTRAIGSTFSFAIGATAKDTPIQVDWGNGTLVNYTIWSYSIVSGTLASNTIKIYGVDINYLYLVGNMLYSLDVTNNTALTHLDCGDNQLTTLDVTQNTALTALYCNSNQLTALDVTKNTSLNYLRCESNRFTFATLPNNQATWTSYTYNPQAKLTLAKTEYALNEEIDLSSQLTAGGNTTTYVWKTIGGVTLVKDVDYTENNGKYTFIKQLGDFLYCEMRNATFPELTLATKNISIIQAEPTITMNTTTTVGSSFSFVIGTIAYNTPIKIDWGNGMLASYTIGTSLSTVSGTLAGNTIKIYGVGIDYLDLSNKKLTSLDVSNSTALAELSCYSNKLTTLDVTKNTVLTDLSCYSAQLTFSTLPIKQTTWISYYYSPQNVVKLAKKQYGLTETVDLSSELTVNSNTTNYTWKTKGGATFVAGTDYNLTNGVTTFRKVQTDSVYCQMTNATFPNLTLTTTNIKVSEYPLSVGNNEFALYVYPNPATNYFTIKMAEEIVRVEVYTLTGVKVFENGLYSSTTVTVPLTSMPKGALLIKAYTRTGVYSGKVVKI